MSATNICLLLSAVFLAVPTVRSALRILLARRNEALARTKELNLGRCDPQEYEAERLTISRLRSRAHDLIELSTLLPSWAVYCALAGVLLNLGVRMYLLVGHYLLGTSAATG